MKTQHYFIDLTQRPPRSFRARLGNYVVLARMLDQGPGDPRRGEWRISLRLRNRPAPGAISGLRSRCLVERIGSGKGDGEMLELVQANSKTPRSSWEIEAWSAIMEKRGPDSDAETLAFFAEHLGQLSKTREDVKTWFEFGELDDYDSFGGKA